MGPIWSSYPEDVLGQEQLKPECITISIHFKQMCHALSVATHKCWKVIPTPLYIPGPAQSPADLAI